MAEGMMPNLTSEVANTALVEATAMSQAAARPVPPPSAAPCTRAMVGFFISASTRSMRASARASRRFSSKPFCAARFIQLRSAPAEKLLPRPASTTTRTLASASSASQAAVISAIRVSSKALCTSGRFIHTVATRPFRSISRVWYIANSLHAEQAELGLGDRRVERSAQAQRQHAARVGGVDHPVVPDASCRVIGVTLVFVLLLDRCLQGFFFLHAPLAAFALDAVALDGGQHARGLLPAHHADAGVGPHPEETRRIGAAAHAVVARAKTAADDDGELGHRRSGHGRDHLGAVAGDAFVFVFAADHEAGDVLQEHQRRLALAAQLDEVRALECRFAEQNAVVGDDAHGHAFDARKAADQGGAKAGLELVELGAVDDAGD